MFTNCPHCAALIATDPATDLPPLRCPRCAAQLREPLTATPPAAAAPTSTPASVATSPAAAAPPSRAADMLSALAERRAEPAAAAPSASAATVTTTAAAAASASNATKPAAAEASGSTARDASSEDAEALAPAQSEAAPAPAAQAGTAATSPTARAARDGKPAPSFLRQRATVATAPTTRRRWAMPAVIVALLLTLTLQWLLADRARLAADARWRPLLAGLCDALGCTLPPWREPTAFALLGRDVRPHPSVPGALRVTATFRNDARWPQPWPQVLLTLSDVEGHAVGARAFAAEEYLGAAPAQPLLDTGQTATLRLDVLEPAPRIVAFAFDFR